MEQGKHNIVHMLGIMSCTKDYDWNIARYKLNFLNRMTENHDNDLLHKTNN